MTGTLVRDRLVYTWEEDGWPVGCLTGREDTAGGVVLEHVVGFPGRSPSTLSHMLRGALRAVWGLGYTHVCLYIPDRHSRACELTLVARKMGFDVYERRDGFAYFVAYRPEAA